MKTITIRDLRNRPREARAALERGEEALLTVNGRPVAVMLPVSSDTLDETLRAVRRARAQGALEAIRETARSTGRDRLRPAEIQAAVAAVRRERRRRRRLTGR